MNILDRKESYISQIEQFLQSDFNIRPKKRKYGEGVEYNINIVNPDPEIVNNSYKPIVFTLGQIIDFIERSGYKIAVVDEDDLSMQYRNDIVYICVSTTGTGIYLYIEEI